MARDIGPHEPKPLRCCYANEDAKLATTIADAVRWPIARSSQIRMFLPEQVGGAGIVFATICCGYVPRCALETSTAAEPRIKRIVQALKESKYSILPMPGAWRQKFRSI